MIKSVIFKDRVFKDQKSLFHALKDNEVLIIDLKKSHTYKSSEKGQGVANITAKGVANKSSFDEGYVYPIINSTHWLDSHQDVHIKGCYTKTVKEQQGKVYYIDTHLKGLSNIITRKQHIEMYSDDVPWSVLGKGLDGETEALIFKIKEDNVKSEYLSLIKEDKELQNSLAMRYMKLRMAVNSTDKSFAENKEVYDHYIESIANKEQAIKDGFFFAVEELAIMGEGSLCPIVGGSNSATSVVYIEPSADTQSYKDGADASHSESEQKEILNLNFY